MTILIALGATFGLTIGCRLLLDYRLPGWSIIVLYLALYWAVDRLRSGSVVDDEPDPDYSDWPTSGPIGRFGQRGLMVPWFASQMLWILNPFQAVQICRQLIGNIALEKRAAQLPNGGRDYETKVTYTLPFTDRWFLYNGGATPKTSHSWDVIGQRFALDFVQVDERLRRHTGPGTRPEQYRCYGEPIVAAADGEVVAVENRVRTAPFLGWGFCDFTARSFIGNHLLVRHAEGEFALYAHLIRDSLEVAPGDRVERGQLLGRCGHTGHSTEPHLHFHLQDSADLFNGMGLPVRFSSLERNGEPVDGVLLTAGDHVAPESRLRPLPRP